MKRYRISRLSARAMGVGVMLACVLAAPSNSEERDVYERLLSPDGAERRRAAQELDEMRRRHEERAFGLVKACLEAAGRADRCVEAIGVLGETRSPRAAPLLAEHLLYDPRAESGAPAEGGPTEWDKRYPCAEALARVGAPGLPLLLQEVRKRRDNRYSQAAAQVIRRVLGSVAEDYVLREGGRETEKGAKEALDGLMACLKAQ